MDRNMALETEIRFYESHLPELEKHHKGKYVVIHGDDFVGAYDSVDAAAASVAGMRIAHGWSAIR